jgi:hypothetical protein
MSWRVLQHLVCVHLLSRDVGSFIALANRIVNFVAAENMGIFFEWLRGK